MKNAMQLKTMVKNIARKNNVTAQAILQNYMMEQLLIRISSSKFRTKFILKGGFLVSAIVGIQSRTTMDMDVTACKIKTNIQNIKNIFAEICKIDAGDSIEFKITAIEEIRQTEIYSGIRIHINAIFLPIVSKLKVDITIGDKITPKEIIFKYKKLFGNGDISMLTYNIESILAEKLETVLSRNILNTRMRDFYDVYILQKTKKKEFDLKTCNKALLATFKYRGTLELLKDYKKIVLEISKSEYLHNLWNNYSKEYSYANNITFSSVCKCVRKFLDSAMK